MHMRVKKWARPELSQCPYYTDEPEKYRGHWADFFRDGSLPLDCELGCGKGVSTSVQARTLTGRNLAAIDISTNVLGDVRRNAEREFSPETPGNLAIVKGDIEQISAIFAPEDRVQRLYISFPNPWDIHPKHYKRRLTHPRQLMQYREFLTDGGQVWFKTDDDQLFQDSREYFAMCGFTEEIVLPDLHGSGFSPNFPTEHELRFSAEGIPIKFAIFRKGEMVRPFDPVQFSREEKRQRSQAALPE